MIIRENYISKIRPFYDTDLIKIITGVRRCGKSVILEQVKDEISKKTNNYVYIDFEDRATTININNWKDIVDCVNNRKQKGLCYVFLDEIQEIEDWSLAVRSLRKENCSIFITGSNSKLLSGEFTKELSGRYVSFRMRPFVYKELAEYAKQLKTEISINDYLIWGGFPKRLEFNDSSSLIKYLNDLDETIVNNDIISRYKIKKSNDFRKLVNFVLINNARKYSIRSITNTLASNGIKCSHNTISKWISYLEEAYIIDELSRYSHKAKKELEQSNKLYNCDVSLNSIRVSDNRYDLSHNLENIVYNELIYMGYNLSVYDNNGKEIDFIANKDNKSYFIQVAYSVVDDKTYQREFGAFKGISQNNRRIIITNDETNYSTSNIEHISLKKFLSMDSLDE